MAELTPRMKELVQPYLAGIEPYDPNFTPTRINLSANENTYPVPACCLAWRDAREHLRGKRRRRAAL